MTNTNLNWANDVKLYGPSISPTTGEYRGMAVGESDGYTQYVTEMDYEKLLNNAINLQTQNTAMSTKVKAMQGTINELQKWLSSLLDTHICDACHKSLRDFERPYCQYCKPIRTALAKLAKENKSTRV